MESALASVVVIFLILFSLLTISTIFISSQDALHDAWLGAEARLDDRSRTTVSVAAAQTDSTGRVVLVTLRNEGSTRLADFDAWDVIVEYDSNTAVGGLHIAHVAQTTTVPVNALPQLATYQTLVVGSASTVALSNGDLLVVDPDDADPQHAIYVLAEPPTLGTLDLDGVTLTGGELFTQADINTGRLTYSHAGSGETDSFSFTFADTTTWNLTATEWQMRGLYLDATSGIPEAFEPGIWNPGEELVLGVHLTPAVAAASPMQVVLATDNGAGAATVLQSGEPHRFQIFVSPRVETNAGLTIPDGAAALIGAGQLWSVADGQPADIVQYTITAPPTHGFLTLGPTFTQADIDDGLLTYQHDGSGQPDSFAFTVSDGLRSTGEYTFEIAVN